MSCENCEESAYVIDKLAKLLAEIAVIVNGPEPHDTLWSYHDLPQKVRALKEAQQPAAAVPDGYALVPVADLESLAFTDFGRAFWTDGAEAAALRIGALLAAVPPAALAVPEGEESPAIGDYVLGTKYSDGDPGDPWAVGIYAGMKDGRHVVTHHDGTPIYAKGFRRVGKITHEQGRDMLKVSRGLEGAGGSLWAMLAAANKENTNG